MHVLEQSRIELYGHTEKHGILMKGYPPQLSTDTVDDYIYFVIAYI
jgi:hypothetical protein